MIEKKKLFKQIEDGSRKAIPMHTVDGKWKYEISVLKKKVIAWMPLPEPYKEEVE